MQRIVGKLVGGGIRIIPIQDIAAIQSELHVQRVFLRNGRSVEIRSSLLTLKDELEKAMPGQFVGTSKGILINVLEIESIYSDRVEILGGLTFPLAKRYYRKFQDKVLEYFNADTSAH